MTEYEQLAAIAATHTEHLAGYATDLTVHDKNTLASAVPGARYVWILREHGTELFPVGGGLDPVWATYWLKQGNSSRVPSLTYLITVGANVGAVKPITYDRAERLANEPHPDGLKIKFSLFGERVIAA